MADIWKELTEVPINEGEQATGHAALSFRVYRRRDPDC